MYLVLLYIPLYYSCCWVRCRGDGEVCAVAPLRGTSGKMRINECGRKMDGGLVGGSVTLQSRRYSHLQKSRNRAVAEPEGGLPAPRWQQQPPHRRPRVVTLFGWCKPAVHLTAAAARPWACWGVKWAPNHDVLLTLPLTCCQMGSCVSRMVNFHFAWVLGVCSKENSGNLSSDFSVGPKSLTYSLYVRRKQFSPSLLLFNFVKYYKLPTSFESRTHRDNLVPRFFASCQDFKVAAHNSLKHCDFKFCNLALLQGIYLPEQRRIWVKGQQIFPFPYFQGVLQYLPM